MEFYIIHKGLIFSTNILFIGNKDLYPLISYLKQKKLQKVIISYFPSSTILKNIVFINKIAYKLNLGI